MDGDSSSSSAMTDRGGGGICEGDASSTFEVDGGLDEEGRVLDDDCGLLFELFDAGFSLDAGLLLEDGFAFEVGFVEVVRLRGCGSGSDSHSLSSWAEDAALEAEGFRAMGFGLGIGLSCGGRV